MALGAASLVSARHAADPGIPLRLFRDPAFRIAAAISLITGIAMFGAISYLPTYLQIVTGVSATTSGLLLPLIGGLPRCAAAGCLTAGIIRLPSEPRISTNRTSR